MQIMHTILGNTTETITDEVVQRIPSNDAVLAEIHHPGQPSITFTMSDATVSEKLEKFVEDVK